MKILNESHFDEDELTQENPETWKFFINVIDCTHSRQLESQFEGIWNRESIVTARYDE